MSARLRRVTRAASVAVAVGAASALVVPVVRAEPVALTACNSAPLSRPFAPWVDPALYELGPGGDFENGGWTLSGAARRVAGSEPYSATGTLGSWSLALPWGSSVQSPSTCVTAAYPTVRFFISGTGAVLVSIVQGDLQFPAGIAVAGSRWLPSPLMVTSSALLAATSDGVAEVSVRLTALSGEPRVDDVFIDPWNRG